MSTLLPIVGAIVIIAGFSLGLIKAKTRSERIVFLTGLLIILGVGFYGSIQMNKKSKRIANQRLESDEASSCNAGYDYRDWVIKYKGRNLTVRACLVKNEDDKVLLKSKNSGAIKSFHRTLLSKADIEYLNSIGEERVF